MRTLIKRIETSLPDRWIQNCQKRNEIWFGMTLIRGARGKKFGPKLNEFNNSAKE